MIKSLIEKSQRFSHEQSNALIDRLDAITEWDAQLHLCPSIRHIVANSERLDAAGEMAAAPVKAPQTFRLRMVCGRAL